jgi:NAD(P)-dependent dehydrogenase (short-subunit alcohol dehydrogenase family)
VAAKHGLIGFTKTVALETAQSGVTCNAICPGWVLTPLVQKQVDARAERDGLSNEDAKKRCCWKNNPPANSSHRISWVNWLYFCAAMPPSDSRCCLEYGWRLGAQ